VYGCGDDEGKYSEAFFDHLGGRREPRQYHRYVLGRSRALEPSLADLGAYARSLKRPLQELTEGKGGSAFEQELRKLLGREANGPIEEWVKETFTRVMESGTPLEDALRGGSSWELRVLNSYLKNAGAEPSELLEHVVAASKPFNLYLVDALGTVTKVEKATSSSFAFCCVGEEEKAEKYLSGELYMKDPWFLALNNGVVPEGFGPDSVTLDQAVALAIGALKHSMTEIGTGGSIDIAIIKKESITEYGGNIRNALKQTEENEYRNLMKALRPEQTK